MSTNWSAWQGTLVGALLSLLVLGAPPLRAEQTLDEAVARVNDSVLMIKANGNVGSGFVVTPSGQVLTCKHVVGEAAQVTVVLANRVEVSARVVARDTARDLALLQLERSGLPAVTFALTGALRPGTPVAAVGAPYGLENSVTQGVISAVGREIRGQKYLQIDASLNRGNSGGPVIDGNGHVVGVATAVMKEANSLGFALPSEAALEFLKSQQIVAAVELGAASGPAEPADHQVQGPGLTESPAGPRDASPSYPPWLVPLVSLALSLVVSFLVSWLVTRTLLRRWLGGRAPTPPGIPPSQDLSDVDITLH